MARFFTIVFLAFMGCGYTTRGFVYKENSIYIKPVVNKISITSEDRAYSCYINYPILLEKKLTNILVNKFNIDGHLKVSDAKGGALRLVCRITDYTKEPLRYTDSDEVKEQRLRLKVHLILYSSEGTVLKEKDVVGETSFFISGSLTKTEVSAQDDLLDDTARRIVEAVVENW